MPHILVDLDMPADSQRRELTPDQLALVGDMLDTDCGWDSAIVRLTWVNDTTIEMTRVDTYRRNPGVVTG